MSISEAKFNYNFSEFVNLIAQVRVFNVSDNR